MYFRRLLVASFLLIFTATAASAYTVVMRNGRRVEIPNTFTLTKSTLTYETAPGIQVTIQLATIDVAATEQINGQAAGSFLTKATETKVPVVQTQRRSAARSITNQDLEVYRRARIENERQRQALGLPSAEDRQREVAEIDARTQEEIRNIRSREELDFWKSRAMGLEAQVAATQTQMSNMNNQVVDYPWAYPYGIGLVSGGFPFGFNDFHGFNRFGFNNGFNNLGFNKGFNSNFGFNRSGFRGRLLFTTPSGPRGGFSTPMRGPVSHGGGGFRGGRR